MIKRFIWVGLGVAIGVMTVRKASEVKQRYGPEGLNRAVGSLTDSVANFAEALREGSREREADLRLALGLEDAVDGPVRAADRPAPGDGGPVREVGAPIRAVSAPVRAGSVPTRG